MEVQSICKIKSKAGKLNAGAPICFAVAGDGGEELLTLFDVRVVSRFFDYLYARFGEMLVNGPPVFGQNEA